MKKSFFYILLLFVAFPSLFISCNNEVEDETPEVLYEVSITATEGGSVQFSDCSALSKQVKFGTSLKAIATPDEGWAFLGWYMNGVILVKPIASFAFPAITDMQLTAKFEKIPAYEAVDLGLSVKWATFNVGASRPERYGCYYAWGETEEKDSYSEENYLYYSNGSYADIGSNIAGTQYDVAHVKWGGAWRMPTSDEQYELIWNCDWEWTTIDGVKGYKVKSRVNDEFIFLPASGFREDTEISGLDNIGTYWSSVLRDSYSAHNLRLRADGLNMNVLIRSNGLTVRPVIE